MTPAERESIIQSVISSQALSGVHVTREMAEAAFERAFRRPLPDIGGIAALNVASACPQGQD